MPMLRRPPKAVPRDEHPLLQLIRYRRLSPSKYMPHQGAREKARRARHA